jgi:hypothetical protein
MLPTDGRTLIATRLWQGGELPFMELCSLWRHGLLHVLQGQVTGLREGQPFVLRYSVECDAAWCTRAVRLELDTPPQLRELHITVDTAQRWTVNGQHRPELDGLFDVDIQVSPSTNTLPFRRLRMAPGTAYAVNAAWVKVPGLEMEPIPQHYACIDKRHLHYRSGTFSAEIELDDLGLVERYGMFWRRMPSG